MYGFSNLNNHHPTVRLALAELYKFLAIFSSENLRD